MAKKTTDTRTLELIKQVQRQKEEISQAEKPNWVTNCSFSYSHNKTNDAINLHVEASVQNLLLIGVFLKERERGYNDLAKEMGVEAPAFSWQGFSVSDWLTDIKNRINKIQIASKKKKLEVLESRLNSVISPELRAELELQAIEEELNS
jgi:monoamine oxidase